jgi:hypothetical protein
LLPDNYREQICTDHKIKRKAVLKRAAFFVGDFLGLESGMGWNEFANSGILLKSSGRERPEVSGYEFREYANYERANNSNGWEGISPRSPALFCVSALKNCH